MTLAEDYTKASIENGKDRAPASDDAQDPLSNHPKSQTLPPDSSALEDTHFKPLDVKVSATEIAVRLVAPHRSDGINTKTER